MRLIAGLCCGALLLGQEPALVYRSSTQLVEMSVVALDKKGQPVKDLAVADIEIQDGGKRSEPALWRYEGVMVPAPEAAAGSARVFSNYGERATTDKHVVALVLDTLNAEPLNQTRARIYAMSYLQTLAPNALVAIYQLGREVKTLHDFTSDSASLRARLARTKTQLGPPNPRDTEAANKVSTDLADVLGLPLPTESISMLAGAATARVRHERAIITLNALNSIGAHLGAISGRKSLVWLGDGIPNLSVLVKDNSLEVINWLAEIRKSGERLAQRGVVLYTVDAHGLETELDGRGQPVAGQSRYWVNDVIAKERTNDTTRWSANELVAPTGGRVIRDNNDLAEGLRRANADLAGSYTLAFYSKASPDGKWHPVKLKCRRAGVELSARGGYLAEAPPVAGAHAWGEADWKSLIVNPLPANTLAVEAHCALTTDGGLDLTLYVAARHLAFDSQRTPASADVDVALAEKQASGEFVFKAQYLKVQQPCDVAQPLGLFRGVWKPEPATRVIRLAVRDRRTGRLGVVDVPLSRVAAAK
jgi:VWFA-related protein